MPPRSSTKAKPATSTSAPPVPPPSYDFPTISQKFVKNLRVETLLEDQIVVLHVSGSKALRSCMPFWRGLTLFNRQQDVLTPQEVKTFLSFFSTLPMIHSPPPKRGEALRTSGPSLFSAVLFSCPQD